MGAGHRKGIITDCFSDFIRDLVSQFSLLCLSTVLSESMLVSEGALLTLLLLRSNTCKHNTGFTYCLSCAQALLTLHMSRVQQRLKAVRDKRNIVALSAEINRLFSSHSDEKLNETSAALRLQLLSV